MRILWIEDFPKESDKPSSLAANLFKDVLGLESFDEDYESLNDISKELPNYFKIKNSIHEIVVCKSYHEYINTHDLKYLNFDIFIVDINLTDAEPNNSLIPAGFNRKDFLEKSGFYIWNLLIRKGVPEDQIAFMTGNGNSVSDFEKHCRDANIPLLKTENVFEKSEENEDSPKFKRGYISFRKWLQLKASNPYIQLRRGILDGCEYLLKNTPEEILLNRTLKKDGEGKKIDELSQEYGKEFLIRLQGIQQKEFHLDGKEKTQKLYTFLMTLVSEWERGESKDAEQKEHFKDISDEDEKTFYETSFWILNNIRNCFAHFTFDKENLNEQDIAFFFILAIRGFFKLDINDTLDYEKILFSIMPKANEIITKEQIEKQNSKSLENIKKLFTDYKLDEAWRRLPKKGQQGERINKPSDYKGYALRFLDGAKQNHNAALIPIPKTEIQKESKSIFYNTYLHGMGSFLTEANKEKVYYRLANYSFST